MNEKAEILKALAALCDVTEMSDTYIESVVDRVLFGDVASGLGSDLDVKQIKNKKGVL